MHIYPAFLATISESWTQEKAAYRVQIPCVTSAKGGEGKEANMTYHGNKKIQGASDPPTAKLRAAVKCLTLLPPTRQG